MEAGDGAGKEALVALSPWPSSTAAVALRAATKTLRGTLGRGENTSDPFEFDDVDAEVQRLGAAVAARVEDYAPSAPQPAKDEAVIRGAAWLRDTRGAVSKESVGPLSVEHVTNTAAWFLHSGAASLLTRWKVRRGGAC